MTEPHIKQASITTSDITQERLQTLKSLFPDLFDHEGNLDEEALKALVNPQTQTLERFRFEWAGKQESKRLAFKPSKATLIADKDRSIDFDTTQNMIIEGDNLEVLKLLRQTYFEKIKCIYIDPPYNTGHDFIYPDNFADGKKAYWQKNGTTQDGVKLQAITESSGRKHSNWLNMMQSRLLLAQQLLREDGVIFISIDDNEQANLKKLCDEVFGEDNFRNQIMIRRGAKSVQAQFETWDKLGQGIEYILFYTKNSSYRFPRQFKKLKEAVGGSWNNHWRGTDRPTMRYEIFNIIPQTGQWRWGKDRSFTAMENYEKMLFDLNETNESITQDKIDAYYENLQNHVDFIRLSKNGKPEHYIPPKETTLLNSSWNDLLIGSSSEILDLFDAKVFDTAKLTPVISRMLNFGTPNDIILDFFAGSGTTAHAVMQLNAEDGGNRKYICVQIPEYTDEKTEAFQAGYKTISQLCIERVKRAGNKIKAENSDKAIDTGFRVYKLTDSHFPENLFTSDPDKSEADNLTALEEHLKQASQKTLFDKNNLANIITEISLKNGYGLFFSLETVTEFDKNTVYRLAGNDKSTLLCLDNTLHENTVDSLIDKYFREHLIISKHAVDTAKKWLLYNAFTDNMQVV
jgi:adenine-specific DNA-methyltransferase